MYPCCRSVSSTRYGEELESPPVLLALLLGKLSLCNGGEESYLLYTSKSEFNKPFITMIISSIFALSLKKIIPKICLVKYILQRGLSIEPITKIFLIFSIHSQYLSFSPHTRSHQIHIDIFDLF